MKLCYKIWIDNDGKAFGTGPYNVLYSIDKYGSLNEAAKKLNMSYTKAWKLINMVEERLGFKIIERHIGGNDGGGSYLTIEAKEFMKKYEAFRLDAEEALDTLYNKYFA